MTVREIFKMAKDSLKEKDVMDLEVSDDWLEGLWSKINLKDGSELAVRVIKVNPSDKEKSTEIEICDKVTKL